MKKAGDSAGRADATAAVTGRRLTNGKMPFFPAASAMRCLLSLCAVLFVSCRESESARTERLKRDQDQTAKSAKLAALEKHAGAVEIKVGRGSLNPKLTVDFQELAERGTVFWTEFYRFDIIKAGTDIQLHLGRDDSEWLILDCSEEHLKLLRSGRRENATSARMLAFFSIREVAPIRFKVGARMGADTEFPHADATMEFFNGIACRGKLIDLALIRQPVPHR